MLAATSSETDPRDLKIAEQAHAIAELTKANEQLKAQNRKLEERIKRLEALLATKVDAKSLKKPVFPKNYSLDRNKLGKQTPIKSHQRNQPVANPLKPKNISSAIQLKSFPKALSAISADTIASNRRGESSMAKPSICDTTFAICLTLSTCSCHRAVRNSRSEFGTEVILILGYLHYRIGVSQENAVSIMNFFMSLELSRSQADSLLTQLPDDWELQHDTIAELTALQTIVYIDGTGWKVGKKGCYTWIFSTAEHVLLHCGVSRKKSEATSVLGDVFNGIGVTDDHAAHKNLFSEHQLCWAHLLRKAIKLVLSAS